MQFHVDLEILELLKLGFALQNIKLLVFLRLLLVGLSEVLIVKQLSS